MTEPEPRPHGSEYADALRAVVEHAARANAPQRSSGPRRAFLTRPPVMILLAVGLAAVAVRDIRMLNPEPAAQPPEREAVVQGLSVLAAGQAVEAYRRERGALPASLEEVGLPTGAFEYVRSGEAFEVRAVGGGSPAGYDSRAALDEIVRGLIPPEGTR